MDGISVVGTDVHPVDPEDGQELRQDESKLAWPPVQGKFTKYPAPSGHMLKAPYNKI